GLFGATRVSGSVDNGGLDDPNASRMSTQYWRACHRGSGSLVEDINIPYDIADPPELPFPGAELQFALVAQRHGTRRSQYLWSKSPYYKGTAPSQLSVQGAYELRVSGIEVRHYLQKYKKHKLPKFGSNRSRDNVLRETCGFDLERECKAFGLEKQKCTSSSLVNSILNEFPADTIYMRAAPLPRTQWSAVFFLEGFFGLPWLCGATATELIKTPTSRNYERRCLLREVCDADAEKILRLRGKHQETCAAVELPCIHVPFTPDDGLTVGAMYNAVAYNQGNDHFVKVEGPRDFQPEGQLKVAVGIAEEVYGAGAFDNSGGMWNAGEMWLSEAGSGDPTPMVDVLKWVEKKKRYCKESGECDPLSVPTYKSLVSDLTEAFRLGYNQLYGSGGFAKFVASPYLLLFNSLARGVAFGRQEDMRDLRLMLGVMSDFDSVGLSDEAVLKASLQRINLFVLSLHDFVIVSTLSALGIYNGELSPFACRFLLELVKAPGGDAKDVAPSGKVFNVEDGLNPGGNVQYPRNGYHVRVLYGKPGKQMEALVLPWCENKTVCPLNDFLNFTYGLLKSKSFLDVTDVYRTKLREAAKRLV
ncbi:histidine acid phosphatase superfamily protein, partial [Toxoplasma gondii CAST]